MIYFTYKNKYCNYNKRFINFKYDKAIYRILKSIPCPVDLFVSLDYKSRVLGSYGIKPNPFIVIYPRALYCNFGRGFIGKIKEVIRHELRHHKQYKAGQDLRHTKGLPAYI